MSWGSLAYGYGRTGVRVLRCSGVGLCQELLARGASAGCQGRGLFWGPSRTIQTGCLSGLWHPIQAFPSELVSQLRGMKLFGPNGEIRIQSSSLSLTLTLRFLRTWKSWWPSLASIKPSLGRTLAGSPGTAPKMAAQRVPLPTGQHPRKPRDFLQISTPATRGAARDSKCRIIKVGKVLEDQVQRSN